MPSELVLGEGPMSEAKISHVSPPGTGGTFTRRTDQVLTRELGKEKSIAVRFSSSRVEKQATSASRCAEVK